MAFFLTLIWTGTDASFQTTCFFQGRFLFPVTVTDNHGQAWILLKCTRTYRRKREINIFQLIYLYQRMLPLSFGQINFPTHHYYEDQKHVLPLYLSLI